MPDDVSITVTVGTAFASAALLLALFGLTVIAGIMAVRIIASGPRDDRAILERLAAIEHDQWIVWATSILESEVITPERAERWRGYMVPYDDLDEGTKEHDRVWARKVIKAVR